MSETIWWRVDRYMDSIRPVSEKKKLATEQDAVRWGGLTSWDFFATEEEARAHIVARAEAEVARAEKQLVRAKAHRKRVRAKFGSVL